MLYMVPKILSVGLACIFVKIIGKNDIEASSNQPLVEASRA